MKKQGLSLALVLALVGLACDQAPQQPETGQSVILPTPNSPLVSFRLQFLTGSVHDPAGKNGLNALTALMLGQGGTVSMSYDQVNQALYPWAASISAQFDKEVTTLVGEVHRDHLEPFYAILRALILQPRFDPEDFQRNKDFLINSLVSGLRGNNDEELGKQALEMLLYPGHPYQSPTMGTELGLKAITLEDVRTFHREHYTQDNLVIGLAGGFPEGFSERLEEDLRSNLPATSVSSPALPEPRKLEDIELLLVEKEAIATAISIGFPIQINRSHRDFYALMVANSYFGEHRTFNGLLMNKMRGERGLNYGNYSYIENFIQSGMSRFPSPNIPRRQQFFSIWIRPVPHHNAHFALRQAIRELQQLVEKGIGQEDFEASRDFLLNYTKLHVQTANRRLGYALDSLFYEIPFVIDEIDRRLSEVTLEEVNAAIRKHLQYQNLAVAVVRPDAETFKTSLLSNQPSPPTYNSEVSQEILAEDEAIQSFELWFNAERAQVVPVEEMFRQVSN